MTTAEKNEIFLKEFKAQNDTVGKRCKADIEKYRKGDVKLVFKDKNGETLKNKKVTVRQKTHDFKFGANIFMLDEFKEEWENKAYREIFAKYFNLATVPFYWSDLEPEKGKPRFAADSPKIYRRPAPDLCVDYCREKGILPKLHCLFYDTYNPDWLPIDDEAKMLELCEKRFREIAERYSGKMYEYEVTNETLCAWYWEKKSCLSGMKNIIEKNFDVARKYFPHDKLVINESNPLPDIITQGYFSRYYLQLEKLIAEKTPIDKIGIQNHVFIGARKAATQADIEQEIREKSKNYMNPGKILGALDKISEFGLPLEMTEVTVSTLGTSEEDEELQAEIIENLYTLWFSHPAMESVVYWNIVDETAFINPTGAWDENKCRGGLFHRDLTPKKSAKRLYRLLNETWHTELTLTTDENGEISFRGFYGDYEAETNCKTYNFGIHKNSDNNKIIL